MSVLLDNIRLLCKSRGVTIAEVERCSGIGNGIIARWGTSSPTVERLQKVASYFNVSLEYLVSDHSPENEKQPIREDELSAVKRELISLVRSMPDEKVAAVLAILKS